MAPLKEAVARRKVGTKEQIQLLQGSALLWMSPFQRDFHFEPHSAVHNLACHPGDFRTNLSGDLRPNSKADS